MSNETFRDHILASTYENLHSVLSVYEYSNTNRKGLAKSLEMAYKKLCIARNDYIKLYGKDSFIVRLSDKVKDAALHRIYNNCDNIGNMHEALIRIVSIAKKTEREYKYTFRNFTYEGRGLKTEDKHVVVIGNYLTKSIDKKRLKGNINVLESTKESVLILTSASAAYEIKKECKSIGTLRVGPKYELLGKIEDDTLGRIAVELLDFIETNGLDLEGISDLYFHNLVFAKGRKKLKAH